MRRIKYFGKNDMFHNIEAERVKKIDVNSKYSEITIEDLIEINEIKKYCEVTHENNKKNDCNRLIGINLMQIQNIEETDFKKYIIEGIGEYLADNFINLLIDSKQLEKLKKENQISLLNYNRYGWDELLANTVFVRTIEKCSDQFEKALKQNKSLQKVYVRNYISKKLLNPIKIEIKKMDEIITDFINYTNHPGYLEEIKLSKNRNISKLVRYKAGKKRIELLKRIDSNSEINLIQENGFIGMKKINFLEQLKNRSNFPLGFENILNFLQKDLMNLNLGQFDIALYGNDVQLISLLTYTLPDSYYEKNPNYTIKEAIELQKLQAFKKFLERNKISIYNVINYVIDVWMGNGFYTIKDSENYSTYSLTAINKHLCTQIDSLLCQFQCLRELGVIEKQLINMSTEPINFKQKSFGKQKNIYGNKYSKYFNLLHSQCVWAFPRIGKNNLFEDLRHGMISKQLVEKYSKNEQEIFRILIKENIISYTENNILTFTDEKKADIMKLLFENGCVSSCDIEHDVLEELISEKHVEFDDNLFSTYEIDYLNFIFKNGTFIDELGLRNEYLHTGEIITKTEEEANLILINMLLSIIFKIIDDIHRFKED